MFRAYNLLGLPKKGSTTITLDSVIKKDIILWFSVATLFVVAYMTYAFILSLAFTPKPTIYALQQSVAILYQPLLMTAIVIGACLLARQKILDISTWILCVVVILFYTFQLSMSISIFLLPNSPLQPMISMVGLLSMFRLFSYYYTKRIVKYNKISMTSGAFICYGIVALTCWILTSATVFNLIYSLFGHQGPS